jgi:Sec-independent protein secretion pathway component TatC
MAIVAALITPTPDAVSMLFMWVPMGLLYELGIWLAYWTRSERPDWDTDVPDPEEMVEV